MYTMKRFDGSPYFKMFTSRRMAVMVILGFSSGLPRPLTWGTLQAWLTTDGLDLETIGIFSIVGLPYVLKFLWSPLMDRFVPPWLGRRRGWILPIQLLLVISIVLMALCSPAKMPLMIALLAFMVAFISASQDIVIDAYRTDILPGQERGLGAATSIFGYRMAMLAASPLAFIVADRAGWQITYFLMAAMMFIGVSGTFLGREPDHGIVPPHTLEEAVWGPLKDFFRRKSAVSFILLIILYKLGDAYAGALTTTFLLRGVSFTLTEVGTLNKAIGIVATIAGALFGGGLMVRLGLFRSLMFFGVLQMVSNLAFMVLAWIGKNYPAMIVAVSFENLAGGMGSAAFVAFLMALCNKSYSATQYALLSSVAALGAVVISPTSGYVVKAVGWPVFFFITTIVALPGLALLWWLRDDIKSIKDA
jgi:MFS transporter, PAT family, beta-lactamase induction signal transducer AmpG